MKYWPRSDYDFILNEIVYFVLNGIAYFVLNEIVYYVLNCTAYCAGATYTDRCSLRHHLLSLHAIPPRLALSPPHLRRKMLSGVLCVMLFTMFNVIYFVQCLSTMFNVYLLCAMFKDIYLSTMLNVYLLFMYN